MARTRTYRWICPLCGAGKLAPSRPRRDDARRFCLPCTDKTGRLVERTCPALTAKRQKAADRRSQRAQAAQAAKARQRQKARETAAQRAQARSEREIVVRNLAAGMAAYFPEGSIFLDKMVVEVAFLRGKRKQFRGYRGTAHTIDQRIKLWVPPRWTETEQGLTDVHMLALHELAHLSAPPGSGHNADWRERYLQAVELMTGIRPERPGLRPGRIPRAAVDYCAAAAIKEWIRTCGRFPLPGELPTA